MTDTWRGCSHVAMLPVRAPLGVTRVYARGCLPSWSPGRTGPKEQEPVWGRAEKAGRRRTGRMGRGEKVDILSRHTGPRFRHSHSSCLLCKTWGQARMVGVGSLSEERNPRSQAWATWLGTPAPVPKALRSRAHHALISVDPAELLGPLELQTRPPPLGGRCLSEVYTEMYLASAHFFLMSFRRRVIKPRPVP